MTGTHPNAPSSRDEHVSPVDIEPRKRVSKACDRCRLKKVKCDGQLPCPECQTDHTFCRFGERRKSVERKIPPGYVVYLEEQQQLLVRALRKTWVHSALVFTEGVDGLNSNDVPINTILTLTGCLPTTPTKSSSTQNLSFEEDLDQLQARLSSGSIPSAYPSISNRRSQSTSGSSTATSVKQGNEVPIRRQYKQQPEPLHSSQAKVKRSKREDKGALLGRLTMPPLPDWPENYMQSATSDAAKKPSFSDQSSIDHMDHDHVEYDHLDYDTDYSGRMCLAGGDLEQPAMKPTVSSTYPMHALYEASMDNSYRGSNDPMVKNWLNYPMSEESAPAGWLHNNAFT